MSTLKDSDPCTDTILDFIAGGVAGNAGGESGGNYNAVIGDAAATDDLSVKTLSDIYALMSQLLSDGEPSTAVGRYQIIRHTLQSLQAKAQIPNSALFTPELQDKLAVLLLIGRGYPKWWRGVMGDQEFAHGLSMEWASLPDPYNGGKSHYDGIGPNHAGTSLGVLLNMLAMAHRLIGD